MSYKHFKLCLCKNMYKLETVLSEIFFSHKLPLYLDKGSLYIVFFKDWSI